MKSALKFVAATVLAAIFGFYTLVSFPSIESYLAPVFIKYNYRLERVGDDLIFEMDAYKVRPCRLIASNWTADKKNGRTIALEVHRENNNGVPFVNLGRIAIGPLKFADVPRDVIFIELITYHQCHFLWNTMTAIRVPLISLNNN